MSLVTSIFNKESAAKITGGVMALALSATVSAAPDLPWTFAPLPELPPIPENNPITEEKVALGKQLFFDPRLSVTGTHSCNSCHNLSAGGEDGRAQPVGVYGREGKRSTLPIWNAAFHTVYNWDGSTKTLEEQAIKHMLDENIMGMEDEAAIAQRIADIPGYTERFNEIFADEGVTPNTIAMALATFERTLTTPNGPFDRYLRGDETAVSEAAKRGAKTFLDIRCASCHFWVNMAGPIPGIALKQGEGFYELFPNYPGTDYEKKYNLAEDKGRIYYSNIKTDERMWRMPGLRNVAVTAPYFHNGAVKTLDEAVRVMAKTQLKRELTEQQVGDIVAYLESLTGEFPEHSLPRLPATPKRTALHDSE